MITPELRVTKDGEPRWRIRFRHEGQRPSFTFTTEEGALEFARLIHQLGPEQAISVLEARTGMFRGEMTVKQLCEHHLDNLTGVQPDTIRSYRGMIPDLGKLAELPANAVTPTDIGRWVEGLVKKGNSGKTAANKHGFLASVYKRAVQEGTVETNPCLNTRLPRTEQRDMVFLTRSEYKQFLEYIPDYWRSFVTFLFFTGLRFGEATALRISDLDLEHKRATVARSWKSDLTIGPPKSRRSRRTIRLPDHVAKTLRGLVENRAGSEYVFLNRVGNPIRQNTFHKNVWAPAVRLINGEPANRPNAPTERSGQRRDRDGNIIQPATTPLGKRPRIHDARHTCVSWLLAAGVPIHVVQAHLGHESITTTVDRYGHVMPEALDAIAEALEP